VPGNIDVECHEGGRRICRVVLKAKCGETTMNCAKKYSGVPLKQGSVRGKSSCAMVLRNESECRRGRVA